ncbi:winged helix-turn-helix transcriptional regulator [Klenkia terrae]|uniref:winged helix-turn-helix transcriptional regulator n=1 Tax=Klenkia terrae TaxID=1052259 RepID=UPI00360BD975
MLSQLPGRPCPAAAALEVVGDRWALLAVREIHLGAHRFSDILAGTGAPGTGWPPDSRTWSPPASWSGGRTPTARPGRTTT